MRYKIAIGDSKFDIEVGEIQAGTAEVAVNGKSYQVNIENYAEVAAGRGLQSRKTMTAASRTTDMFRSTTVDSARCGHVCESGRGSGGSADSGINPEDQRKGR